MYRLLPPSRANSRAAYSHVHLFGPSMTMPPLIPLLRLLLLISCSLHAAPSPSSAAAAATANGDTLTAGPGQALAVGGKLVSRNGKFALGFFQFQPPSTTTTIGKSSWYLGIWFNTIPAFTTVWIANRDDPITVSTDHLNQTHLKISSDGNLFIVNHAGNTVWSTNITANNRSTNLLLENSGNLALTSADGALLWQSFDDPTDVILPGAKFSRNKVTGFDRLVFSRKSLVDPGLGSYVVQLGATGVVLRHRRNPPVTYWSWASGASTLKLMPILEAILQSSNETRGLIRPVYVDGSQEEYYMYTSPDDESTPMSFVSLDISGQIKLNIWSRTEQTWQTHTQPADACTPFATCGPFTVCDGVGRPPCACMESFSVKSPADWEVDDRTGGCVRDTPLRCAATGDRNTSSSTTTTTTDVFHAIARVTLPYNPQSVDGATSQSKCQEACLGSCSCTAYAYNNSRCSVWHEELLSVNLNDGIDNASEDVLYLRLAAEDLPGLPRNTGKSPNVGVLAAASIAGFGLLVLIMVLLVIWRRRKFKMCCGSPSYENQGNGGIIAFRYTDLVHATKNFSDKLGAGGFGSVYKGVLSSGDSAAFIAVKRLNGVCQGEKQFRAEVSSIGLIQHINLVKLIGFCCEGDHRLLVYEHMVNGSLEAHLFKSNVLNWNTRYEIALGVARGLSYLHQSCRDRIIHCDVKPENVLLDASFVPKVADFGMAAFVGRDFSRVLTTFRGTAGYLAPEWLAGVAITPKIDVYGFGMVMLEMISGRRNSPEAYTSSSYHVEYFPVQAISKLQVGDVQSLVDPGLHGDFSLGQAERVCRVACWCIQDNESDRPTMGEVVRVLEGLQEVDVPPMPRLLAAITERSSDVTSM